MVIIKIAMIMIIGEKENIITVTKLLTKTNIQVLINK